MRQCIPCFLAFIVVSICRGHASEMLCRDWQPYKEVLCYRVFADEEPVTWTEAKARCQSKGMRLLSIGNHGEQKFVVDLLFKESHLAGNVWIDGAFFNGSFRHGETGLELSYSRWAHNFPKKLPDYCIEISRDLETRGRWRDVPCSTRNALVCQQTQRWDWTQVMTVQRQMQTALQQLTQSTQTLERKLSQTTEELKVTKQKLMETNLQLDRTKREFSRQLVNSKQIIGNELIQTKQEMSETKNNFLPIGFIYVQLPKSKTPSELWPSLTWTEVSADYAGIFFRVTGGEAADFGEVQEENAPRLTDVDDFKCINKIQERCKTVTFSDRITIPRNGTWSDYMVTADSYVDYTDIGTSEQGYTVFSYFLRFRSQEGEVRPINMAVKVWKRTA